MTLLGRLWCPRCKIKRPFICPPDDPDPGAARCDDCGYQFGYRVGPDGKMESVLSRGVVSQAQAELARERAGDPCDAPTRARAVLNLPPQERAAMMRASQPHPGWDRRQWESWATYRASESMDGLGSDQLDQPDHEPTDRVDRG